MKIKTWVAGASSAFFLFALSGRAHAEVTLLKPAQGWEVYTSGRVGGFMELVEGQGLPLPIDTVHKPTQEGIAFDTADTLGEGSNTAGNLLGYRVRSGFVPNVLTFGVRNHFSETTTVTGQISIWGAIESQGNRTYQRNIADVREGFLKVEGPAGTLLVGRGLSLFGRGATEIDFLYGHGYAVGAPQGFTDQGPSAGHIGFGVLANVFVAGVSYTTPSIGGLQLAVGYYDPARLVGVTYSRTKLGRPEARLSYTAVLGANNKLNAFVEGAFQNLYDSNGTNDSKTSAGVQAGARVEVGPVHLGVAGFSGKGLGINYFLSQTDSINNQVSNNLRPVDGGYLQAQLVLHKFDFNLGAGITRAHQMTEDLDLTLNPNQPSYLKSQRGISAVVVYHFAPYLHGAFDYFRGDTNWWGGEKQGVNSFNLGLTATW